MIDRDAVLQRVRSTRIRGKITTDRAGTLAGRVGRVMVSTPLQMLRQMDIHQPRLDDGITVTIVHFQDPLHSRQCDHHTPSDGQAAPGQTRPRSTRYERYVEFVAKLHNRHDLLRRGRKNDHVWRFLVDDESVTLINEQFIRIEEQVTSDADVRDFQTELRACTEGTLTGSDDAQYSEAKFLQVKHIIERLRGREGSADADRRWAAKVTDVRQWFVFAASERWREDGREHEHYSDSGGKSGGQKEKLAYTILAASLAYQFGLEWGATRSRSFRFVVIDEAFGRGSDESAEYGLRLFKQLGLQLLIVTPLQKIHVIEPFVASVGFVHNEDGSASKLRNLGIEEYRAQRDALT